MIFTCSLTLGRVDLLGDERSSRVDFTCLLGHVIRIEWQSQDYSVAVAT
jgi:hypothetical protein